MSKTKHTSPAPLFILICLTLLLSACANVETKGTSSNDPIENINRKSYGFNEDLDQALIKPIAETYANVTPKPVRRSVTNFFDNITYLNVILNALLQGKFDQAVGDSLRFVYNSTFGIAGLFDVASGIGGTKNNEDFGQTLATWGVDQGAYVYIPFMGPNTARNVPDTVTKTLLNPLTYVSGGIMLPFTAVNIINKRAELLEETQLRDDAAVDPYSFTREAYLQRREYLIYDGNPPLEGYDDIFDDGADSDSGSLIIE